MSHFKTTEDYAAYAEKLSYEQLSQASNSISKERFPERYEILQELLNTKYADLLPKEVERTETDKVKIHISIIKCLYIISACITSITIVITALNSAMAFTAYVGDLFFLFIQITIIYGLQKTRNWARILTLLWASLSLTSAVIFFFSLPSGETGTKIPVFLAAAFGIYQILIFSSSKCKKFFGERGQTVITS